jgi:hypothetical protein
MKQAFSRARYKVSMYPYCLNTRNKVPYSCEFAVYVVIFRAVRGISVTGFLFSRVHESQSCLNIQVVTAVCLSSATIQAVYDSPKDIVEIKLYPVCEGKAHRKKAHRSAQNKGMEKNVFLIKKFKTRNFYKCCNMISLTFLCAQRQCDC